MCYSHLLSSLNNRKMGIRGAKSRTFTHSFRDNVLSYLAFECFKEKKTRPLWNIKVKDCDSEHIKWVVSGSCIVRLCTKRPREGVLSSMDGDDERKLGHAPLKDMGLL